MKSLQIFSFMFNQMLLKSHGVRSDQISMAPVCEESLRKLVCIISKHN